MLCVGTATSVAAPTAAPDAAPAPSAPAGQAPVERLIVGYKSMTTEANSDSAAAKDAEAKGKKAGESLDFDRRLGTGAALVDLGGELGKKDADDVMAAFRADPDVAYVVPDRRVYAAAVNPNDTEYQRQWDLFESAAGMNVPGAWDKATGEGVKVAVIDTGYVAHSDLAGNVIAGYDFISDPFMANDGGGRDSNAADPGDWMLQGECGNNYPERDTTSSWHGTHVAGTIAATTNNSKGIAGIAYNATIQPVRVLGKCGGTTADIMDSITWASGGTVSGVPNNPNPADVINMSLGGSGACDSGTQSAINAAVNRGTTVVVAAGNSNANAANFNPANCSNVITVAASDREGNRASYSNYGTIVDITAPGGETAVSSANGIWSTLNSGTRSPSTENYKAYQGTSMAAPHIAGLAALMYQANPSVTPAQVESSIRSNARTLPGTCSGGCGAGLADAARTLGASGGTDPQPPTGSVFTNANNVNIPDTKTPVTSSLAVTGISGNAPADLQIAVDIKHTYRGDLKIEIVAPSGASAVLQNTSSDSADNVITTYTVDASGVAASGTWKLRVTDMYSGDTGYIDSWSLTF
ncbi:S8 family peptidase [Streptomyces pristinaespiralis]|jgi:serine protease|uniref:Peptidase S8 and S53 n=2 Tax=Streptomyces pristinaespiralis TaxID=38300 RepID=D6XA20_STRE2|nr:S8 family serine peptidase [Streptomyces pristinaespiralis]EFH31340.1 peptidase S8 and S53 [Streptomyces pristinaespiralis ATCC 25486]QMU18496.1 S8 family serine peptidase [Streptomyces pristinaespiralis]